MAPLGASRAFVRPPCLAACVVLLALQGCTPEEQLNDGVRCKQRHLDEICQQDDKRQTYPFCEKLLKQKNEDDWPRCEEDLGEGSSPESCEKCLRQWQTESIKAAQMAKVADGEGDVSDRPITASSRLSGRVKETNTGRPDAESGRSEGTPAKDPGETAEAFVQVNADVIQEGRVRPSDSTDAGRLAVKAAEGSTDAASKDLSMKNSDGSNAYVIVSPSGAASLEDVAEAAGPSAPTAAQARRI